MNTGKVTTFYSFKGGVGRTMALANVAFLAAESGQKVLVMDWDLEAPGLAYYFKSLLRANEIRRLKEAKGLLDLFWNWHIAIRENSTNAKEHVSQLLADDGLFSELITPIQEYEDLSACLHFIGAGNRTIRTPSQRSYEEALALFSWQDFFEVDFGGVLLDSFKRWATSRYDLVLLDSRTGMADVSGICTMQMPDSVALCFVLNHQNIDGVARVAAAIRAKRGSEIELRAVPMRVFRRGNRGGSYEESDAIYRAESELTRVGGFSKDAVQRDFKTLAVEFADNVPFYESLAPFVANDPRLDNLTLNYVGLASNLLGKEIQVPDLSPIQIEEVRSRLQPKSATVEYIMSLRHADPNRAVSELKALVEGALQSEIDGIPLDVAYIESIVEAGFFALDLGQADDAEVFNLQTQILELARVGIRTDTSPRLLSLFTQAVQRFLDTNYFLDDEWQLSLLEELDANLSRQNSANARVDRIRFRRRAARILVDSNNSDAALTTAWDFLKQRSDLLKDSLGSLSSDQLDELNEAEIDHYVVVFDAYKRKKNSLKAKESLLKGLSRCQEFEGSAFSTTSSFERLYFQLLLRAATDESLGLLNADALDSAVRAIRFARNSPVFLRHFIELGTAVLKRNPSAEYIVQFCDVATDSTTKPDMGINRAFAYSANMAKEALELIVDLCGCLVEAKVAEGDRVISKLKLLALGISSYLARRRHTIGKKGQREALINVILKAAELPSSDPLAAETDASLRKLIHLLQ